MQADGLFPLGFSLFHHGQDLFQGHFRAVINGAVLPAQAEQNGVHETARIDADVRLLEQLCPPQGDEIRGPRPRADKVDHGASSFTMMVA